MCETGATSRCRTFSRASWLCTKNQVPATRPASSRSAQKKGRTTHRRTRPGRRRGAAGAGSAGAGSRRLAAHAGAPPPPGLAPGIAVGRAREAAPAELAAQAVVEAALAHLGELHPAALRVMRTVSR